MPYTLKNTFIRSIVTQKPKQNIFDSVLRLTIVHFGDRNFKKNLVER